MDTQLYVFNIDYNSFNVIKLCNSFNVIKLLIHTLLRNNAMRYFLMFYSLAYETKCAKTTVYMPWRKNKKQCETVSC